MAQWYHSGIEGYCKAAAQAMGLPNDQSGWGNFGRDLFGDNRFDDPVKASKTWTLSRFRNQGRSNRPILFEKSWLTTNGETSELAAVNACVQNICDALNESTLITFFKDNYLNFASSFGQAIIPAIADGFRTERYHSSDTARFTQIANDLLGQLRPSDGEAFRSFATVLVAGLIYGPDHMLVRSHSGDVTYLQPEDGDQPFEISVIDAALRITQVFDENCAYTGYSELFEDGRVIFLGRSSNLERYLAKCDPTFASETAAYEPMFFPISESHSQTSNEHGAIARLGETWYYHDFSTNGSYIINKGNVTPVHDGIAAIAPGDIICLGIERPAKSEAVRFGLSSTILVSFTVNETIIA